MYLNVAVAVMNGAVGSKYYRVVEVGTVRGIVDYVAIVACIAEGSVAADGIVTYIPERIVDVQMYLNVAVAVVDSVVGCKYHSIVEVSTIRSVVNYVAIVTCVAECSIAADGVVTYCAEGVVDMQTDNHVAVTVPYALVQIHYSGIVQVGVCRTIGNQVVTVGKHIATADSVVTYRAERVIDMQTDNYVAIAVPYCLMPVNNSCVVQVGICRTIGNQVVTVSEHTVATNGVVPRSTERIIYVQTDLNVTVAIVDSVVGCKYHRVVEVGTVRGVVDYVAIIACVAECSVAADGIVTYRAEGVIDMQTDNHVAIAVPYALVQIHYSGIVQVGVCRTIGNQVIAVSEHTVAADGIITYRAESVVDVQMYLDSAVTAEARGVDGHYRGVVKACPSWHVTDDIASIASVGVGLVAADGLVTHRAEGVSHKEAQDCYAVAAVHAVVQVGVVTRNGICAILVALHLTGADSIFYSIAVNRMNGNFERNGSLSFCYYSSIAIAHMTCLSNAAEGSIGESGVTSNCLCIN